MNYVEMLKEEFLSRKERRPSYSERAFARDLKLSSSYINLLFRGRRELSVSKGTEIGKRLNWSNEKIQNFVGLIQQSTFEKALVSKPKNASSASAINKFVELDIDRFQFIADLDHLAALALIQSAEEIGLKQVQMSLELLETEAQLVVDRLIRLGLIRVDKGLLKKSKKSLEIKDVPSEAVRLFHRHAIRRAEASIEEQTMNDRNLAALTLSFDKTRMNDVKAFINRFLKNFEKKFGHAKNSQIYQLNTQFFKVTRRKT